MDLGIPRTQLDAQIHDEEEHTAKLWLEAECNPRALLFLVSGLESLTNYHCWAGSDPSTVHGVIKAWLRAYIRLLDATRDLPGEFDSSTTSSCETLRVLAGAWIVNEKQLVGRLATAIWDPPEAAYVGPASETCRPDQQQFALAVREYVLEQANAALEMCRRVKPMDYQVAAWTTIFSAILTKDGARIPGALSVAAAANERILARKKYPFNVEYGVLWVVLGLTAEALRMDLVRREHLPDAQFLPYALIVA